MFKKVLIAEDHESTNISVRKTLEDLGISACDYVFYCDDAFKRISKAVKIDDPYDLLITDLSFEEDQNKQELAGGVELIKAARIKQPDLKIIVFSGENKHPVIHALFEDLHINGYVRKARNDAQDLKKAIERVYKGQTHVSPNLKQAIIERNSHEFTSYDITIITLLYDGMLQKDIPKYLQANNIKPSGLSSVEKRFNLIKEVFGFANNGQLLVYCRNMGII